MKSIVAAFRDRDAADHALSELGSTGVERRSTHVLDEEPEGRDLRDLMEGLRRRKVPDDRAQLYGEVVRRGGALLLVDAEDDHAQQIADLLDRRGSIDVDAVGLSTARGGVRAFTEEELVVIATDEEAVISKHAHVVERVGAGAEAETRTEPIADQRTAPPRR